MASEADKRGRKDKTCSSAENSLGNIKQAEYGWVFNNLVAHEFNLHANVNRGMEIKSPDIAAGDAEGSENREKYIHQHGTTAQISEPLIPKSASEKLTLVAVQSVEEDTLAEKDVTSEKHPNAPQFITEEYTNDMATYTGELSCVLHVAMERNNPTTIRGPINALPAQLMSDMMTMKDMAGNTAIHSAAVYNQHEILQDILSSVKAPGSSTLQLLLTPNSNSLTAAVLAAGERRYEMIEVMLQSLTGPDECIQLLRSRDLHGYTVFHRLVVDGSIAAVRNIQRYITGEHLDQLMKFSDDINRFTPLHEAILQARTDMVIALMDPLTDEQKLELLQINDGEGNTAWDLAVSQGHTQLFEILEVKTTTSAVVRKVKQEMADQDEMYPGAHTLTHGPIILHHVKTLSEANLNDLVEMNDSNGLTTKHQRDWGNTHGELLPISAVDYPQQLLIEQDNDGGVHIEACSNTLQFSSAGLQLQKHSDERYLSPIAMLHSNQDSKAVRSGKLRSGSMDLRSPDLASSSKGTPHFERPKSPRWMLDNRSAFHSGNAIMPSYEPKASYDFVRTEWISEPVPFTLVLLSVSDNVIHQDYDCCDDSVIESITCTCVKRQEQHKVCKNHMSGHRKQFRDKAELPTSIAPPGLLVARHHHNKTTSIVDLCQDNTEIDNLTSDNNILRKQISQLTDMMNTITHILSVLCWTQRENRFCSTHQVSHRQMCGKCRTEGVGAKVQSLDRPELVLNDLCPQRVEEEVVETTRETQEAVMVCDIPTKAGKERMHRHKTKGCLRQYRYSPALYAILFNQYTGVSASKTNPEEIYNVYELRTSELQAKYTHELERMLSYESDFQSRHMNATALARSGLINLKKNTDAVVCVWCCVQFCNFRQPLDAAALHLAYSEHVCEFIKHYNRINVPFKKVGNQQGTYLELASSVQGSQNMVAGPSSQSTAVSAAGEMLTIASGGRILEEDGEASVLQSTVADRYIQFERRIEAIASLSSQPQNMRYEKCRLMSYISKGWTAYYAEQLAAAGFYLIAETNGTLTVACPFCDGKIPNIQKDTIPQFTTEKDHSPLQVHILKFPACAFIQGNNLGARGNVPMINGEFRWNQSQVVTSAQANSRSDLVTIGIATTHADCPAMAVYERRIESFLTLPYDHPKAAEELATCGFYNTGIQGSTKCFWCGVDCESWSSAEDVWVRHARSMRTCQFVVNEKGLEFVNGVIAEHGVRIDNYRDEDRIHNVTTRMIRPRMDSWVVQAVIGMGYSRDHVKSAIINRLKKLKPDYTMIADLMKDVLDLQHVAITYQRDLQLPDVPVMPKAAPLENDDTMAQSADELQGAANATEDVTEMEVVTAEDRLTSHQPETPEETVEPQAKSVLDLSVEERLSQSAQMMSQLTCKICISSAVGIIFLPCAHLVCCTACAAAMTECPMCRRNIVGTIKANV